MSDDGGASGLLRDAVEGLAGVIAAIAGYVGLLSMGSARKLVALESKIDSLTEMLKAYRSDDLMYRVDIVRRLERLELRRHQQDNREGRNDMGALR